MTILALLGWLGDAAAGCAVIGMFTLAGRMIGARGTPRPVRVRVRR